MKPKGFWQVVGHKPYSTNGLTWSTSTFATKDGADKFAKEHGGKVKHIFT